MLLAPKPLSSTSLARAIAPLGILRSFPAQAQAIPPWVISRDLISRRAIAISVLVMASEALRQRATGSALATTCPPAPGNQPAISAALPDRRSIPAHQLL